MANLPPRHSNDLSAHRRARSKREVVAGIKPHTPNRKCIGDMADEIIHNLRLKGVMNIKADA